MTRVLFLLSLVVVTSNAQTVMPKRPATQAEVDAAFWNAMKVPASTAPTVTARAAVEDIKEAPEQPELALVRDPQRGMFYKPDGGYKPIRVGTGIYRILEESSSTIIVLDVGGQPVHLNPRHIMVGSEEVLRAAAAAYTHAQAVAAQRAEIEAMQEALAQQQAEIQALNVQAQRMRIEAQAAEQKRFLGIE